MTTLMCGAFTKFILNVILVLPLFPGDALDTEDCGYFFCITPSLYSPELKGPAFSFSDCFFKCPVGKYNPTHGQADSDCIPCEAGKFNAFPGSSICGACDAGKFSSATEAIDENTCSDCVAGKYSQSPASTFCTECAAGKYSTDTGASSEESCSSCGVGEFSGAASESCTPCGAGKFLTNPEIDEEASACQVCAGITNSPPGSAFCPEWCPAGTHCVNSMSKLYSKVSNGVPNGSSAGNSIMPDGDTAVLEVRTYKCRDGTCAIDSSSSSKTMLMIEKLWGSIMCSLDTASCILDGESSKRLMTISGTEALTLTLRALTFENGQADGGALRIMQNSHMEIVLCVFRKCTTEKPFGAGGGALLVECYLGCPNVNITATRFVDNHSAASGKGNDIRNWENRWGTSTINILETCPSPFFSNTPTEGEKNV